MELKPCAKCGSRVSDLDISQGDGVSVQGKFYCCTCARDLNIKSDYTAVSALSSRRNLSDSLFFTRAGKLYDAIGIAPGPTARRRPRTAAPRSRAEAARAGERRARSRRARLIIIASVAVTILLVIAAVLVVVRRFMPSTP